jgi:hypothetical protein
MNDLALQALHVASVTRTRAGAIAKARPSISLALGGFLASCLIVVAGGRIGTVKSVIPLSSWFGLMAANGIANGHYWPGTIMLTGVVLLVVLWLVAVRVNRPDRISDRHVWCIAGIWSLPLILGPPLLSNDVYTYAAQGVMLRDGINTYTHGPGILGNVRAVAAVDPSWRNVGSPYGPLATIVQHLAVSVSGGNPLGAVIVFRGLGVASVIAIGLLAANLAGPRRVQALTLTALNPLLLLQVISAAHFEGIMCALLLAALVAANQRRWVLAVILGCCAGSVKAPAFIVVLAVIAVHATGRPTAEAWRRIGRDAAVAIATIAGLTLLVPHGYGWIANLNTPGLGHTPLAPASLLGDMFSPVVKSASFDDLATGGRITALAAAGCTVLYLILTANRRALNRTTGYGLLAVGVFSPVMYPWYLLWGLVCLAPTARAARADWLVLASALMCIYDAPGFNEAIRNTITLTAVGLALLIIGPRTLRRYRLTQAQARTSS